MRSSISLTLPFKEDVLARAATFVAKGGVRAKTRSSVHDQFHPFHRDPNISCGDHVQVVKEGSSWYGKVGKVIDPNLGDGGMVKVQIDGKTMSYLKAGE